MEYDYQKNYDVIYIKTATKNVLWSPWQQHCTQLGDFLQIKITTSKDIFVRTA